VEGTWRGSIEKHEVESRHYVHNGISKCIILFLSPPITYFLSNPPMRTAISSAIKTTSTKVLPYPLEVEQTHNRQHNHNLDRNQHHPLRGFCSEKCPTKTVNHADHRVEPVEYPLLWWDHRAGKHNRRCIVSVLDDKRKRILEISLLDVEH